MALCGVETGKEEECKMNTIAAKGFAFRYIHKNCVKMLLSPIYIKNSKGLKFFSN